MSIDGQSYSPGTVEKLKSLQNPLCTGYLFSNRKFESAGIIETEQRLQR